LAAAKTPIVIGYLANLTGDGASWGQHERDGAILAVENINQKGGVLGRPLKLVVYDAKGRPEDAINAVRRMIDSDKVVAIGGANYSGINLATGPVVAAGKVPQIATFATNPFVTVDPKTNKVKPYSFRICFTDPYQGKVMAEYLVKKLGIKHAAVLSDVGSDYSEGMTEYFIKTFEGLGGKVESFKFRSGDVDFRAQLTNAKKSGAKALVMPDLYKEMALMMKQAHELDWRPVFIGGDGYSNNMAEIAGPAMEGSYWVYHLSFDDPKIQPLVKAYAKRFGTPPTEVVNTVAAYDIIYWIADAIRRAGKADGPAVRDALASTKDLKLLHFTLTLDPRNNNPLNKPATMLQYKDGKIRYLETFKPQTEY
jgi:branched-chain amino acid transport system substrate-binding protein